MSDQSMPVWALLKAEISGTDKSHHVANRVLKTLGITRPAVDVHDVARRLGIVVKEPPVHPVAGEITSTENSALVQLNGIEPPVRRRFTLAHEIGHLLLHPSGRRFRDVTFEGNPEESEANQFAADLLMPLWMLDAYASAYGNNVAMLAKTFAVSQHAMQIQVDKLTGYPVRW